MTVPKDVSAAPTSDAASTSAPPPALIEKEESEKEEEAGQQQQQQQPPSEANPAAVFIENLVILPPRQKNNKSHVDNNENDDDDDDLASAVALPPLRPEEPVSSLRGALGEVLGFAHLTRYRLVAEERRSRLGGKGGSGRGGGTAGGAGSNRAAGGGSGGGRGGGNSNKGGKNSTRREESSASRRCWSPFTLREAQVTLSPSFGSLLPGKGQPPTNEDEEEQRGREEQGQEELVLDEYGDLSALLPLLEAHAAQNAAHDNAEAAANDANVDGGDDDDGRLILDGSRLAIRVVLERYDLAAVRDHVERTRQLLAGNPPYATSLLGDDEAVEEDREQRTMEAEQGGAMEEQEEGKGGEAEKEEEEKKGDENKDEEDPAEAEATARLRLAEAEKEKRAKKEAMARALPSFPPDHDLHYDRAARGGDLGRFYYHACGEERMVAIEEREGGFGITGNKGGDDDDYGWLDDMEQKENDKKKGGNNGGGGKKKKAKNGKSSANANAAANDVNNATAAKIVESSDPDDDKDYDAAADDDAATTYSSMMAIERTLHRLNESCRVSPFSVRLSGYHPPPPHRRVLGDLAYLEASMPDGGAVVHLTAFPRGFYVNRSTSSRFDPSPAVAGGVMASNANGSNNPTGTGGDCYSHALLDSLLQRSASLRSAWTSALAAGRDRSALIARTSRAAEEDPADATSGLFRSAVLASCTFPNNSSGPSATGATGTGVLMASSPGTFVPRMDYTVSRPGWLVPLPPTTNTSSSSSVGRSGNNNGKGGGGRGNNKGKKKKNGTRVTSTTTGVTTSSANKTTNTWDHDAMHRIDPHRPEEELCCTYGMDVRGGGLRDWNEELQVAREMPSDAFGERIERARLVHKVLSDFGDAALAGVKAILDGYILPMNPNEPARSHVYLHNNIFFSRAVDAGLDTFKIIQGDAAAKKSASRDAHNMGVLHRLDVPGLHTLATVLVEYLGQRLVCQSVVPGILHGDKSHTLLYGAVETLSALRCDEEMHKLLESSLGESCMVATRKVPAHPLTDERMEVIRKHRIAPPLLPTEGGGDDDGGEDEDMKDKSIQVCGPMEMKGILGSDKRKYVLDCTRLTPRDANWVSAEHGGTGRWEDKSAKAGTSEKSTKAAKLIPVTLEDDEWTSCVLRPELVTSYAEVKIGEYLREHSAGKAKGANGEKENDSDKAEEESKADAKESLTETKEDEKDWVDVNGSSDSTKKEETKAGETKKEKVKRVLAASKVEEDYIRSLRYNVNVFLPFTRSIETIDRESHEKLKEDEEEARKLARYLWDAVMPLLTRDVRASSNTGMQLPVDGKSLTDLIHSRGINCRYMGRLAELARKEELEDIGAYERASTPAPGSDSLEARQRAPRFRMPVCWLEQLECEMVARAAKHVLDSYILEQGGASTAQPAAQTIASFLSAVVSVGEEGAAETEIRTGAEGHSERMLDQEDMSALTLFIDDDDDGCEGYTASSHQIRGRDEIWSDIEREIGRRYRYTLLLYNNKKDGESSGRALYTPLLRRICQRSGIRLVAKHYDMGKKCVCGGGGVNSGGLMLSYPVAPTDILDILPLVKHAASVAGESFAPSPFAGAISSPSLHVLLPDAKNAYEFGHANMNAGNSAVALDYAREASAMYNRVIDTPVHPNVASALKLTAAAHFHRNELELACSAAAKYLAVTVSLDGFDSAEALSAHLTVADILLGAGRIPEGARHMRAAQFLMEFLGGSNYSGISSTHYRMGSHYYEAGRLEDALRFYQAAAGRRSEDRMFDCLIARNSAGVLARLGQFKPAFDQEKKAYQLYVTFLGEEHDATKACSSTLMQLMKLAVEQEKRSKIKESERVKENAADAVADEIREAEEEAANKPKKKKKQSKKKGKK